MKTFDPDTIDRLEAGEVDALIGIAFLFDSGIVAFFVGAHGQFTWSDEMGNLTYYGMASLLSIDIPKASLANEAESITVKLFETYLPENSDVPVNIFDADSPSVRDMLDGEPWQGREAVISYFWRDAGGGILMREQIARRIMDSMPQQFDETGRPIRVAILERPDVIRQQIEGRSSNAEFQRLIDPADKGFYHVAQTATQKINFGKLPEKTVKANQT